MTDPTAIVVLTEAQWRQALREVAAEAVAQALAVLPAPQSGPPPVEEYLTVPEAARRLHCAEQSVYKAVGRGELDKSPVSNMVRVAYPFRPAPGYHAEAAD